MKNAQIEGNYKVTELTEITELNIVNLLRRKKTKMPKQATALHKDANEGF